MRVGIDGRSLIGGARRGIGRVTFELLSALATAFPQDEWVVLLPEGPGALPSGTIARRSSLPSRILFGSAALAGRPRLDVLLGGVDVVWLPALAPVAISKDVPSVLTLHDLSWVQRPHDFTLYQRAWHLLARPRSRARRAARVAAVSEQTRGLAIELWKLDPSRVSVVRPPVARLPSTPGGGTGEAVPFFLWVGALEPRKAPDVLEQAWSIARRRGLTARLVVVGDGRVPLSGDGVERRGNVTDAELGALYDQALALVMPSRLEGAGLPPLEAALHGVPSICSDLPVLRESLGPDGALWVARDDADGLAAELLRMAGDPERRRRVAAAAGRAAAARADPRPPAARMRALLEEATQQ
jgi:glycosyltransferase involved in cell wall biosynthesis